MFLHKMIQALSPEEAADISRRLNPQSNAGRLFRYLRKHAELDKAALYRKVFSRSYTPASDHLLRNEARLLKQRLTAAIQESAQSDIAPLYPYYADYVMAGWCLGHQLTEAAGKYAARAEAAALEMQSWAGLLKINRLLFRITQFGKSGYAKKSGRLLELRQRHEEYLQRLLEDERSYADFVGAAAYKLQLNLRKDPETFVFHAAQPSPDSVAALYYREKALAYLNEGVQAVQHLQDAGTLLDRSSDIPERSSERIALQAALAMEYVFAGELAESLSAFARILESPHFAAYNGKNLVLFNYVSTLIKAAQYEDALQIVARLEAEKPEPVVAERLFAMKCYALVFTGDAAGLKSALPADISAYDLSVKIYYRLLFTIAFLLKGDGEAAERELLNMQQLKGLRLTVYEPVVKLFLHYIDRYVYRIPGTEDPAQTFRAEHPGLLGTLPVSWLLSRMEGPGKK
ncbi:MAG: hypothetical protein IBJ09_05240 [Bacteroidia bacterium]|nr:hypothetical protein [Bacteroidia bacterium]